MARNFKLELIGLAVLAALCVLPAMAAASATPASANGMSSGDLCRFVPIANIQRNDLGFRVGWPNPSHIGTRGHAKVSLSARTVSGVMCQANRDGTMVFLTIGHRLLFSSHHAVMFGVPGNILKTPVRVAKTSDPNCRAGTTGTLTVFASYNNVHKDSVQVAFPAACKSHNVHYTGPAVTTNVPPN